MRYRRTTSDGGTWFFSVVLADRRKSLLVQYFDELYRVLFSVREKHPFVIDAMVVLPDHIHAVWTLPEGDSDYPMRWSLIKAGFSRGVPKGEKIGTSRIKKRERGIWQRRYWEHRIRDDRDFRRHVDYIHYNPVKHGFVEDAVKWRFSSIHRYIKEGIIPPDWGGHDDSGDFGE